MARTARVASVLVVALIGAGLLPVASEAAIPRPTPKTATVYEVYQLDIGTLVTHGTAVETVDQWGNAFINAWCGGGMSSTSTLYVVRNDCWIQFESEKTFFGGSRVTGYAASGAGLVRPGGRRYSLCVGNQLFEGGTMVFAHYPSCEVIVEPVAVV